MSHLINEIKQLESVLANVRREHGRAVDELQTAVAILRDAEQQRDTAREKVRELKAVIEELTASLQNLKKANDRNGAVGGP